MAKRIVLVLAVGSLLIVLFAFGTFVMDGRYPLAIAGSLVYSILLLWVVWQLLGHGAEGRARSVGNDSRAEEREARAEEERVKREREARRAWMNRLRSLRSSINTNRDRLYECEQAAGSSLRQANELFEKSAYGPFWGAVHETARALAEYHNHLKSMRQGIREYRITSKQYEEPAERLSIGDIPDVEEIAHELEGLVSKGQSDFEFAVIYEQRRTNSILVEGFGNLENTIKQLGQSLAGVVYDLERSIGEDAGHLIDEVKIGGKSIEASIEGLREDMES